MAPRNRRISSLTVWPFGGAQFSTFWDGNSLQDGGTEAKPVLFAKKEKVSSSLPSSWLF